MGYDLTLTYANDTLVAQTSCKVLRDEYKVDVTTIRADSSDRNAIDIVYHRINDLNIRLDAVIFNAGITCRSSFEDMKYDDWERVFFANVHFPTFLLQRLIGTINTGGSVVFTGSLMGILPHARSLSYGVTKVAVHALVRNLVKFLTPYQIRVNGVAPGFVETEWQKDKPVETRKNIENKIAAGRFGNPDELAAVYRLLVENTYINGEIIIADGGYSYQ